MVTSQENTAKLTSLFNEFLFLNHLQFVQDEVCLEFRFKLKFSEKIMNRVYKNETSNVNNRNNSIIIYQNDEMNSEIIDMNY